jgi:hypothetical protein
VLDWPGTATNLCLLLLPRGTDVAVPYTGAGVAVSNLLIKKKKEKRKNRFKKSFKIRPLFLFGAQIPIPITSRRARKDASTSQQPWAFISGLNY